jgi:hypothetical protein
MNPSLFAELSDDRWQSAHDIACALKLVSLPAPGVSALQANRPGMSWRWTTAAVVAILATPLGRNGRTILAWW